MMETDPMHELATMGSDKRANLFHGFERLKRATNALDVTALQLTCKRETTRHENVLNHVYLPSVKSTECCAVMINEQQFPQDQ